MLGHRRAPALIEACETEKSFDRLIFEGYADGCGWTESVIVDGMRVSQNTTVEMG